MNTGAVVKRISAIATVAAVGVVAWNLIRPVRDPSAGTALAVNRTLGGSDTAGFERVLRPRAFTFPADHGPHPTFRNEWWYLTGNLESSSGRRFGYQLTWFRAALSPEMPTRESGWASRQAWMAHFALTDEVGNQFHAFEKFSRAALDLAGAAASPFRVWIDDWTLATATPVDGDDMEDPSPSAIFPLSVQAMQDSIGVQLRLEPGKPLVLHGESGLSRKSAQPGNASFYYAFSRLPTTGAVTVGNDTITVSGLSWLDREWSTSALGQGVAGWDWFAIQLEDSSEIMVYRLRRDDGATDPFSAGTFIARDGTTTSLGSTDFAVSHSATWTSPTSETTYPAQWTLRVPDLELTLELRPLIASQELDLSFRYWEGAVTAEGSRAGLPITGRGYVELTGYGADVADSRSAPALQR